VDKSVWEEAVGKDAYKEIVESCDRCEGGVHAMKRESIPFIKRRERRSQGICERTVEEGLYPAV